MTKKALITGITGQVGFYLAELLLSKLNMLKRRGVMTIGFTGFGGGKLKQLADECVTLSSRDYGQAEDTHLALTHILSDMLREKIVNG